MADRGFQHGRSRGRDRGRGRTRGLPNPRAAHGPPPSARGWGVPSNAPMSYRGDASGLGLGRPQGAWGGAHSRGGAPVARNPGSWADRAQRPTERGDEPIAPAAAPDGNKVRQQRSDLALAMSKLELNRKVKAPKRPDNGGTWGRQVEVTVNCWDLSVLPKSLTMYHLELRKIVHKNNKGEKIEKRLPVKEQRNLLRIAVDQLSKEVIYDGASSLFSADPIPDVSTEPSEKIIPVNDPVSRDELELVITLQRTQTVSTGDVELYTRNKYASSKDMPQSSIRLLDCLMKSVCKDKGSYVSLGVAALFNQHPDKVIAHKLLAIHRGFITSVRPQWKVRVNIDMSCKAFLISGNLADILYEKYGDSIVRSGPQMTKDLKNIRVQTEPYNKNHKGEKYSRRFTIYGFSKESAAELMVPNLKISVQEYFANQYGIHLKYPELPCVKVNLTRDVFIPMELLNILPYQSPSVDKGDIASEVIRCAAVRVQERFRELQKFVQQIITSNHPVVSKFGLKVSKEPVKTVARVLDPPLASFGGKVEQLRRGAWMPPAFHRIGGSNEMIRWAIVSVPGNNMAQRHQAMLAEELPKQASRFNMRFAKPEIVTSTRASLEHHFQTFQSRGVQLLLLVLYDDFHYPTIKLLGDLRTGMRTQCVRGSTLGKPKVIQNLLYKINGKLGGVNWRVNDMVRDEELIMVLGADVTHPSPTQSRNVSYSIAAVQGSVTADLMRYAVVVRQQVTKNKSDRKVREIIDSLDLIMRQLLETFARNNNDRLPNRLIFYRDGVSEGQFDTVLSQELGLLQHACSELRRGYEPAITYIVVQKRHHLRFLPSNPNMKNIEPGTVVDTHVTHPTEFDFYLCSQEGIQGTTKPAHYHVLYDDSNWTSDALQAFTYFLCHAYMRCPRSVSYPAPTYYAHLAAFRARDWIANENLGSLVKDNQFVIHPTQVDGMFFL